MRSAIPRTFVHRVAADGVSVFYREAGAPDLPVVLLLHGFPASSFMYRELMPRLADRYRVIAPDLPGFGFTDVPADRGYAYSFDAWRARSAFTDALKLTSMHCTCSTTARRRVFAWRWRGPMRRRHRVAEWQRVRRRARRRVGAGSAVLARSRAEKISEAVRRELSPDGLRSQYTLRRCDIPRTIAPEGYTLDAALMARPGNMDIQLDLFLDYANNVKRYPAFQDYFRRATPPLLAIWGSHDPFFVPPGAKAFRRDNPNAIVQFLDTGHFATETHVDAIADAMHAFLESTLPRSAGREQP